MRTRAIVAVAVAAAGSIGMTGTSWASHEHFVVREDRNGETHCRYIAEGQTSKADGEGGYHQFHDHVHTGQPGTDEHGTDFDKSEFEDDRCDHVHRSGQD